MTRARTTERGASTLEATLVIPVLLLFIAMAIAGGRMALAHNAVSSAAGAAARAASIERGTAAATTAGQAVAAATLAEAGCTPVTTITGGFDAPIGTPATATATVSCTVSLGDLILPGLPGHMTYTSTSQSVIDAYRGR